MSSLNAPLNATTSITPASKTQASASAASSTSSSAFNQLNEQSFLKLLTAQLQHQDPTQPVQQQQLASEMAQFSTATGVNTLNGNVGNLLSAQSAGALAQASALVGKQVTTAGNALVTDANGQATGAFALSGPAQSVKVDVANAAGKQIAQVDLGTLSAGNHKFNWADGSPNQAYQFSVNATAAGGGAVTATPSSLYTVDGVKASGNSINLNLVGNPNPLALSKVQQVL